MDSTSIPEALPALAPLVRADADLKIEGLRVGRITDMPEGAAPDVLERLEAAFKALADRGAEIVDVQVPAMTYGLTAYYLIAPAEASSNLARYDGVRYGMRVEAADTNAMYGKALKVRRLIADDFAKAYAKADVLLTPTSPTTAFPFGAKTSDPLTMYLCDVFTIPTNLAGHAAMSVPFGSGADGLPIGVQILAPALGEPVMFRAAAALEKAVQA
jgi:aspartyl-tRNA(Asn)/glutamyl-tRNA(Gln) amidotransferase subunit A